MEIKYNQEYLNNFVNQEWFYNRLDNKILTLQSFYYTITSIEELEYDYKLYPAIQIFGIKEANSNDNIYVDLQLSINVIEFIFNKNFTNNQLFEILFGFMCGLSFEQVKLYARNISEDKMERIRLMLTIYELPYEFVKDNYKVAYSSKKFDEFIAPIETALLEKYNPNLKEA